MKRSQYFDPATGRWVDADDLPGGIVPDGGRIRVGLDFMDSAPSAERTALKDAEDRRAAAYDHYCYSLDPLTPAKSDQFKTGHSRPDLAKLQDAADSAYAAYVADLAGGTYHERASQ